MPVLTAVYPAQDTRSAAVTNYRHPQLFTA
jgi:hypothetical protein